jgi:hypothetical protein
MPKPLSLSDYYLAAFNAKPFGMFISPNWVGLAAAGILGILNPAFWFIGVGVELGYLTWLAHNSRFRAVVNARQNLPQHEESADRVQALLRALPQEDQIRYRTLVQRCAALVLKPGESVPSDEMQPRAQALERLTWIYLQLLQTRYSIRTTLAESQSGKSKAPETELRERVAKLEEQQKIPTLDEGLRKSYTSQLDILKERLNTLQEARGKLDFLEAELVRIQEQVELIREQTMLANEPGQMSDKIDQVTGTLESTSEWIKEQQGIYGKVADILETPPTVLTAPGRAMQKQ